MVSFYIVFNSWISLKVFLPRFLCVSMGSDWSIVKGISGSSVTHKLDLLCRLKIWRDVLFFHNKKQIIVLNCSVPVKILYVCGVFVINWRSTLVILCIQGHEKWWPYAVLMSAWFKDLHNGLNSSCIFSFNDDCIFLPSHYPAGLKKICKAIAEAHNDEERVKAFGPLQEMITFVQFANDECDYGMGYELGIDLFCYGSHVSL